MSSILKKLKMLKDETFLFNLQKKYEDSGYGVRLTVEEFENGDWFKA